MKYNNYFVYITTNPSKDVLYIGITNFLEQRLIEHYLNRGLLSTFAGTYYCYCLVYFERHTRIKDAIRREKQLKRWSRKKKLKLIKTENVELKFLNDQIMEWIPSDEWVSR